MDSLQTFSHCCRHAYSSNKAALWSLSFVELLEWSWLITHEVLSWSWGWFFSLEKYQNMPFGPFCNKALASALLLIAGLFEIMDWLVDPFRTNLLVVRTTRSKYYWLYVPYQWIRRWRRGPLRVWKKEKVRKGKIWQFFLLTQTQHD